MDFKSVVETDKGQVEINAVFEPDEVAFLIEYAVTTLMQRGAIAIVTPEAPPEGTTLN